MKALTEEEIQMVVDSFIRYGDHDDTCPMSLYDRKCDCGFLKTLKKIRKAVSK